VQALLGCPAVGLCRGVEANCGDLAAAFANTPVMPDHPSGLADWSCAAFPNDDNPRDSLIVGLIAFALALPVTLFLQTCFSLANESEVPESWLQWAGLPALVFGAKANRKWHYTGPAGQPVRFVRWYARSINAPVIETMLNLWESFKAWAMCVRPPWTMEAEESLTDLQMPSGSPKAAQSETDCDSVNGHAVSLSHASAKRLRFSKRRLTACGIGGVYLIWALFSWIIFTYGILIFKLLGPETQDSFVTSFGVSYGVGAAAGACALSQNFMLLRPARTQSRIATIQASTAAVSALQPVSDPVWLASRAEWRDIVQSAAQTLVIMAILERLHVTSSVSWLEEARTLRHVPASVYTELTRAAPQHIDYMSTQALLFQHVGLSFVQQTRLLAIFRTRLSG
jgi:hypothetical protein